MINNCYTWVYHNHMTYVTFTVLKINWFWAHFVDSNEDAFLANFDLHFYATQKALFFIQFQFALYMQKRKIIAYVNYHNHTRKKMKTSEKMKTCGRKSKMHLRIPSYSTRQHLIYYLKMRDLLYLNMISVFDV